MSNRKSGKSTDSLKDKLGITKGQDEMIGALVEEGFWYGRSDRSPGLSVYDDVDEEVKKLRDKKYGRESEVKSKKEKPSRRITPITIDPIIIPEKELYNFSKGRSTK